MTSAAHAKVLNEICYLRITQQQPALAETERWLRNLSRLPQIYAFWQPEPNQHTIAAELSVSEVYQEVMDKRESLRDMAQSYEADFAEVSRDLFDIAVRG